MEGVVSPGTFLSVHFAPRQVHDEGATSTDALAGKDARRMKRVIDSEIAVRTID